TRLLIRFRCLRNSRRNIFFPSAPPAEHARSIWTSPWSSPALFTSCPRTTPITTTMGFNAAKVTVDYWRNVYSLNYEVLMINGAIPPSGITEPSVSQWLPITPPPCDGQISAPAPPQPPRQHHTRHNPHRPLRRDFW